jgi:kynurenine formamidase
MSITSSSTGGLIHTAADVDKMLQSLSNWGRWGKHDQLGALNLITPQKRKQAAALVQEGLPVSLARNAICSRLFSSPPFEHRMIETGHSPAAESSADVYSIQYHGYTQTHLDALCHVFYQGQMYNGFSQRVVTEKGAERLSVINMKNGVFTRAVLMDFPRHWGVTHLNGDQAIFPQDLDAWESETGVKIESGDAVLIQTGRWVRFAIEGEWDVESGSAGIHISCMPWFKERDVAVLASDLALDLMPSRVDGVRLPVHLVSIVAMGVPIIDNCDFQVVAKAAAERKRWAFLLTLEPLAVETGTGSPVNPIAIF